MLWHGVYGENTVFEDFLVISDCSFSVFGWKIPLKDWKKIPSLNALNEEYLLPKLTNYKVDCILIYIIMFINFYA